MSTDRRSDMKGEPALQEHEPESDHLIVRACLSAAVLAAGFGYLLFGSGDAGDTGLAASGIGLVFGHWMR